MRFYKSKLLWTGIPSAADATKVGEAVLLSCLVFNFEDVISDVLRLESLPRQTADRWPWDVESREDSKICYRISPSLRPAVSPRPPI